MKIKMFSLMDRVANQFGAPFASVNSESAIRAIRSESENPAAGALHTHPHDFAVYAIGVFDNETGVFESLAQPLFLVNVPVTAE